MPGVTDQVRRTQMKQDLKRRQKDMEELVKMVKENRLDEADERQLETLKIVAELQKAFGTEAASPTLSPDLADVVKNAVLAAVSTLPVGFRRSQDELDRPTMGHVSIDLSQDGEDLEVSHGEELGKEKESMAGAEDKLKKLREIKGKK